MLVHKNNTLKFIAKIIVYVMHYRFLTLIVNFESNILKKYTKF